MRPGGTHEGDVSLKNGWPLEWWALEPSRHNLPGWRIRYASVFQIGARPLTPGGLIK